MSEIELKLCPFCGGKNIKEFGTYERTIHCCDCGAEDGFVIGDQNGWEGNWNTRPIEDALQSRAEKAEAMVERLIEAGNALKQHAAKIKSGYVAHDCKLWTDIVDEWRESGNCSPLNELKVENYKLQKELSGKAEQFAKADVMINKLIDAGNDLYMAGLPDGCRIEDSPDGEWAAWDALVAEWEKEQEK